jgi:hypothetical protein
VIVPTMDPNVRSRWVAALRSGDYAQGRELLHRRSADGELFCCLGVLCDLAYRDGVVTRRLEPDQDCYRYGAECRTGPGCSCGGGSAVLLPDEVVRWAGLGDVPVESEGNPLVGGDALTVLNDGEAAILADDDGEELRPRDFAAIADLIERFL